MKKIKTFFVLTCLLCQTNCFAYDTKLYIDNTNITFANPIIIQNNRAMIPMRPFLEILEWNVEWLPDTKTIIASKNSKIIVLQIDKRKIISINIETGITDITEIDAAPIIYNNSTFVPVRAISEILAYNIEWDDMNKTVIINKK